MVSLSKERFLRDAEQYTVIPVYKEFRADFETPLSIFLKIKGKFLLESVEKGESVGRYSIIARGIKVSFVVQGTRLEITEYFNGLPGTTEVYEEKNPLIRIREYFKRFQAPAYEDLPPFSGGAIGYLGYETVQYFEDVPVSNGNSPFPDGILIIPEVILVYDTIKRTVAAIVLSTPSENPDDTYEAARQTLNGIEEQLQQPLSYEKPGTAGGSKYDPRSNMTKEYFTESVRRCKEHITKGDIIQLVLSQKFTVETRTVPFELYRTLRIMNPSPYMFFLDFGDFYMIGSSPEVMVRVQNREILLKPIAGTRKRGSSVARDRDIAQELINDPKERAEHIMLVDLGRNDLGRVAVPGSVEVSDFMSVEKYSHVMHIVSTIKAELDKTYDVFDVIAATFPAGTLSGAPKIRAMQLIAELEPEKRGPYGGMVFNLSFNGNLDSCITIRTILLQDGTATVQAGAGIVADSVPESEYAETVNKASALLTTIQQTGTEAIE